MQALKDLAITLSLANLCFYAEWSKLLPGAPYQYFMKAPPASIHFPALILNVVLLAALFWLAVTLARRSTRGYALHLARGVFLLILIVTLNGMRLQFSSFSWPSLSAQVGKTGLIVLGVGLAVFAVYALVRWHRRLVRAAATLVLVLFPFVLVTFSQAVWTLIKYDDAFASLADKPPAPSLNGRKTTAPRILWLLFDEMDQRIAFLERPSTVKLPALDRLRSQALYASNAYPPADVTTLSMPALITGKPISKAEPVRSDELEITLADAQNAVGWSTQPNMFLKAREMGFNTAVMGWFHPYCRIIGSSLTACSWQEWFPYRKYARDVTLSQSMLNQTSSLLDTIPLARRVKLAQRFGSDKMTLKQRQGFIVGQYLSLLEDAKKLAVNADLQLSLVHWPVPHGPGIYNRIKDDFAWDENSDYLDSLALVDRTLSELRRAMESAGTWDNTVVLLTSDHWYRAMIRQVRYTWTAEEGCVLDGKIDHRVPFLLKLAGQQKAVTYDLPFNTIVLHDLLLSLLRGELSSPESVVGWLDQHRSRRLAPYCTNYCVPKPRRTNCL